jgi:hypothetical protein
MYVTLNILEEVTDYPLSGSVEVDDGSTVTASSFTGGSAILSISGSARITVNSTTPTYGGSKAGFDWFPPEEETSDELTIWLGGLVPEDDEVEDN